MKRFSAYIPLELFDQVNEIAERENRSFNQVLQLLLQQALKERERNRSKKKKTA
jgi:hypothetical protein